MTAADGLPIIHGADIRLGDVVKNYWHGREAWGGPAIEVRPHPDPLGMFPDGASIVTFAGRQPITVDHSDLYVLIARAS